GDSLSMSKIACRLFLCAGLLAVASYAQTGVGQIQGTVTDTSGAIVPHAAVSLANTQTDARLQTTTSEVGSFVFPALVPGDYRLTITMTGMQKWEGTATLVAGQRAEI